MKFKDLEVGMLIDDGLITELRKAGSGNGDAMDQYWEANNAVTCFMSQDAYIGQGTYACDDEREFEIVHERGSDEYIVTIAKMASERHKAAIDATNDVTLIYGFLLPAIKDSLG